MVCILNFVGGERWIAKLRTMSPERREKHPRVHSLLLSREVQWMMLLKECTKIPVPTVFDYSAYKKDVGAAFILMEYLPGNVVKDLEWSAIPDQYKARFLTEVAKVQIEMTALTLARPDTINPFVDGSYDSRPVWLNRRHLDALGHSLNTRAWLTEKKGDESFDGVVEDCGGDKDLDTRSKVLMGVSISEIREMLKRIANEDDGPFSLIHPELCHQNIVVDDSYNILGVIDWEQAFAAPREMIDFPSTLALVPPSTNVTRKCNKKGEPKMNEEKLRDMLRARYLDAVRRHEEAKGLPRLLSTLLADKARQELV